MVARFLAHYRILEKLGGGAMGEVHVAEDTRLGRKVALKFLAPRPTNDAAVIRRFEREAKALAALNHPNITTIHSVEDSAGVHFLTMELVEGDTLDRLIPANGMDFDRILEVAIPIADALDAAHSKGIVHRDLKPANIMVAADGRVKILDFGLAKLRQDGPRHRAVGPVTTGTERGLLIGTIPYMSPEQVKGSDVDHRSDLFSFGVMLYEMATGRRPFPEDNVGDLISAILRDTPAPLREWRPNLPPALGSVIERSMDKDVSRRWQSAADLRDALKAIAAETGSERAVTRSIAVLPFVDLSPEKDHDWFCAGLADELILALNRLVGLRVAARSSSFLFQEGALGASEIGRRLNVDTVLEGTLRKADDRLRITATLIEVESGYGLWSDSYDCDAKEVFDVQERIARSIVAALKVALSPGEWRAMRQFGTPVAGAYEYYLKGRKYLNDFSRRGMKCALELFRSAVKADPGYAPAYAGIAESCCYLFANVEPEQEHLDCALWASKKALQLAPLLSDAHLGRAVALSLAHSDDESRRAFEEAIRLNPQSFEAHYFYARHCFERGEFETAIQRYERASELRPEDYQARLLAAQVYDDLGQHDNAAQVRRRGIAIIEERLKLSPDDTRALYMGANGLVALGETQRGLKWARRAQELSPGDTLLLYNLACIYALADEVELAIGAIEEAVRRGFSNPDWLQHDSNLAALRDDPRFATIVRDLVGTD